MDDLKTVSDLVREILESSREARNSDNQLYCLVCLALHPEIAFIPFTQFFLHQSELGVPGFETVRRTRQKLQATFPELRPEQRIETARAHNENVVREWAKM